LAFCTLILKLALLFKFRNSVKLSLSLINIKAVLSVYLFEIQSPD